MWEKGDVKNCASNDGLNLREDLRLRLQAMLDYIKHDACEKIYEIETKTEEEYNTIKRKTIEAEKQKILQHYKDAEHRAEIKMRIQAANAESKGRLAVLRERQQLIRNLVEEARDQLENIADPNSSIYRDIMLLLTIEGLLMLQEPQLYVSVREQDQQLMESIIPDAQASYFEETEEACTVKLDPKRTLDKSSHGGVVLRDRRNRIKLDNTLNNRLDNVVAKILPDIRITIFGKSRRRF